MRQSTHRHPLARYGLAVSLTFTALFLRWLLLPVLGSSMPFILLAVAISAWYGGLGPGLTVTFLTCFLISIFPSLIVSSLGINNNFQFSYLASLIIMGGMISILIESLHREQRKAQTNAAHLAEGNERFHLLVDSAKDYGIFMLDTEGRIMSWNAGARNINGYEAHEIIGKHFSIFYPAEDIADGKPEMELRVATKTGRFEEEGWRLRKDGSRFWASVVVGAVHDNTGELRGFSKVTRDMTQKREAEEREQLLIREQLARVEAENANKAKDQFLAILSHELRTPLNTIVGWAYLLKNEVLDEQTTREACESIERSGTVQMRLVEDLLDVSRMMSGKLSIERDPTDLAEVVEAAFKAVRFSAEDKRIDLKLNGWATPIIILGDSVRLEQTVSNLLQNSIKFTPEGGHVTVELSKDDENASITVRDTGSGISSSVIPYIFDHFRQADSSASRKHGGLGLGLAIVYYIVEAHGGSVVAQSPGEGLGSTFIVQFPLADEKQIEANGIAATQPAE